MAPTRVLSIQSHVVHGYVGNRCAVFCLQRLGIDVDCVNTVQLSNHTGYPRFPGTFRSGRELQELYKGLELNHLASHSHVLTGYMGSKEVLESVAGIVEAARSKQSRLLFVCDPVMGDDGKAYLPPALVQIYRQDIIPLADVLLPNRFEAELMTEIAIQDIPSAQDACRKLHAMGPHTVVITSLEDPTAPENCLTLYASTTEKQSPGHSAAFKVHIPRIEHAFTGTGDLLAALVLALMVTRPMELDWVCAQATSRLHALLRRTYAKKTANTTHLELDLVACQECLLSSDAPFLVIPCETR